MRLSIRSTAAKTPNYRADIDGLRGIAVLSVLLFHVGIPGFPGGFVGVDIFFVISGYLITAILLKDILNDRFSLLSFYDRRIRRIFPALFAMVLFSILAGLMLLAPSELLLFGKSIISAALFVSNLFFAHQASVSGYFGDANQKQVLLHTWSLSVEEQFYLLFPLTLFFLIRWRKQRASIWIAGIAVASFVLNVWMTKHQPVSAFYVFLPRAWELLIGSLLAMKALSPLKNRWAREAAAMSGLFAMIFPVLTYSGSQPFPGLRAVLPCLGAWLCIYAGESGDSLGKSILSFRPLVSIGAISYSLYLWHWPILVFTRSFLAVSSNLSPEQSIAILALSFALAFFSFEFVESPFRGTNSKFPRRSIFELGLIGTTALVVFGVAIYATRGLPGRYDASTRQLVMENAARRDDFKDVCTNWRRDVHAMSDINFCVFGKDSPRKVMFWGDSHAQQLYPLVEQDYENGGLGGRGAIFAIENGCFPSAHLNTESAGSHCDKFAALALERAEEPDIDTVFIAFNVRWSISKVFCLSENGQCVRSLSIAEGRAEALHQLSTEVQELRKHGKKVIVSLPFPLYDKSIPELEIRNAVFVRFGLGGTANDLVPSDIREQIAAVAKGAGAEIFNPQLSLCPMSGCITELNGVSIYKDNNHIAASQISILGESLNNALNDHPGSGRDQRPELAQSSPAEDPSGPGQ